MQTIQEAIETLELSEKSLQEEASGNLEGDRSEGLLQIKDDVRKVRAFLARTQLGNKQKT